MATRRPRWASNVASSIAVLHRGQSTACHCARAADRMLVRGQLLLFVDSVDRQTSGEQEGRRFGPKRPTLVERNHVVVGRREELFPEPRPLLGDLADLGAVWCQKPKVPSLPVAFDFGNRALRSVQDVKASAEREQLALE